MRTNAFMKLLTMFLLLVFYGIYTHASSPRKIPGFNPLVERPVRSYNFNAQFGSFGFNNSQTQSQEHWETINLPGFSLEFSYEKRLSWTNRPNPFLSNRLRRFVSFGAGLGYSQYGNRVESTDFQIITEGPDNENVMTIQAGNEIDTRKEWTIDYYGFTEEFNASFINIPLHLEIGDINPSQIGFFLKLGVDAAIPLDHSFLGNSRHTVRIKESIADGDDYWYLHNIPELGYVTDKELYSSLDGYSLTNFQLSGVINAGISLPIPANALYGLVLCLSGQYSFGITNLVESSVNYPFDNTLKTPAHDIKMVFDNGKPTKLKKIGFQVGLKYSPVFN